MVKEPVYFSTSLLLLVHPLLRATMALHKLAVVLSAVSRVFGASLTQVTNFGENPTKIQMFEYVPDKLAESPAIIVNVRGPSPAIA